MSTTPAAAPRSPLSFTFQHSLIALAFWKTPECSQERGRGWDLDTAASPFCEGQRSPQTSSRRHNSSPLKRTKPGRPAFKSSGSTPFHSQWSWGWAARAPTSPPFTPPSSPARTFLPWRNAPEDYLCPSLWAPPSLGRGEVAPTTLSRPPIYPLSLFILGRPLPLYSFSPKWPPLCNHLSPLFVHLSPLFVHLSPLFVHLSPKFYDVRCPSKNLPSVRDR